MNEHSFFVPVSRFMVTLTPNERRALEEIAERERRDVNNQAAVIIRSELERRGLLPTAASSDQPQEAQPA